MGYNLLQQHTTTSSRKPIPGNAPLYTKASLPPRSQVNKSDKMSQMARLKKKTRVGGRKEKFSRSLQHVVLLDFMLYFWILSSQHCLKRLYPCASRPITMGEKLDHGVGEA
eukprot:scaffold45403_cov57-Attheya_sp.AAC.3